MAGRADVIIKILSDTNDFDMDGVKKQLAETRLVSESLSQALYNVKTFLVLGGTSLAALTLPSILASKAVSSLDTNLKMAAANADDPRFKSSFDDMVTRVRNLSTQYGRSASDVSAAVLELAKAGRDYVETFEMLEPITQLAIANNMDVATSVDIMNKAYTLFGDKVSSMAELADMVQAAVAASPLDVTDIPSMLQYVGSSAALGDLDPSEFFAMAASLSSIAAPFGENFGTLMSRMMADRKRFNRLMGEEIVSDELQINWSRFVEKVKEFANDPASGKFAELMSLWGVRASRVELQIAAIAEDYPRMVELVKNSNGVLKDASDEARVSFEALWGQIEAALLAPFADATVMEEFRVALAGIKEALSSPDFISAVQTLIMTSAQFVQNNAYFLIETVTNLVELFNDLTPALEPLARSFVVLVNILSQVPAPILEMIAVMVVMRKMTPDFIVDLLKMELSVKNLTRSATLAYASFGMLFAGISIFLSSTDPAVRAIGFLVTALGSLIAAIWAYNAAMAFMATLTNPIAGASKIAAGIAAATGVAALAGSMALLAGATTPPKIPSSQYPLGSRDIRDILAGTTTSPKVPPSQSPSESTDMLAGTTTPPVAPPPSSPSENEWSNATIQYFDNHYINIPPGAPPLPSPSDNDWNNAPVQYFDNRNINIYEADKDDVDEALLASGVPKGVVK